MFKKIVNVLIISLLLMSTTGISMTRHFCGNSLISTSIFSTPKKCCDGSCDKCHNKYTYKKVTDEFTSSGNSVIGLKADSQPIYAILIFNISDQSLSGNIPAYDDFRKFLSCAAGDSPAWLSNFRC